MQCLDVCVKLIVGSTDSPVDPKQMSIRTGTGPSLSHQDTMAIIYLLSTRSAVNKTT